MENEPVIIRNQEQHRAILAERRKKSDARQVRTEAITHVDHMKIAHQSIREISAMNIDPFVKKVLILKITGPIVRGEERTSASIALELGASVLDVEQAELYGVERASEIMGDTSIDDLLGRYERDNNAKNLVLESVNG